MVRATIRHAVDPRRRSPQTHESPQRPEPASAECARSPGRGAAAIGARLRQADPPTQVAARRETTHVLRTIRGRPPRARERVPARPGRPRAIERARSPPASAERQRGRVRSPCASQSSPAPRPLRTVRTGSPARAPAREARRPCPRPPHGPCLHQRSAPRPRTSFLEPYDYRLMSRRHASVLGRASLTTPLLQDTTGAESGPRERPSSRAHLPRATLSACDPVASMRRMRASIQSVSRARAGDS